MKRRGLTALLAILLLLPSLAAAAPRSISLAQYRALLQEGIAHLERAGEMLATPSDTAAAAREIEQARASLSGVWRVETAAGEQTADLTDLGERTGLAASDPSRHLPAALRLAQEHLRAAEGLDGLKPTSLPGARESLERALEQTIARSFLQRVNDWFLRLLGRQAERVDLPEIAPPTYWVIGSIGAAALAWIGYSLYRMLAGHSAAGETHLKGGPAQPGERPPTPSQLLALARSLSQRGEYLEALRKAHLALLQRYDELGLIRYQAAQTNREHEAQLRRRHPGLARTLRMLNDLVDDRLYSGQVAAVEDYLKVEALVDQLWREGDGASRGAEATPGLSSSASSP